MILHTETFGSGENLVFLHTGLHTGMTDFKAQKDYFQNQYRVILLDLRGHGKSANADIANFFEDSAKDLNDTLESLDISSAHIAGASLGSLAAIFFSFLFPDKVDTLTLSGITLEKPAHWKELHQKDVLNQEKVLQSEAAVHYFNALHGEGWQQFIHLGKDENWYPFEKIQELKELDIPVLLIFGEKSKNERAILHYKEYQKKRIHFAVIPFAGHLVHEEQPELFNRCLDLFLRSR